MLLKVAGLEIEIGRGVFFLSVSGFGEVWVKTNSGLHGRRWADYMTDPDGLHFYLGRTYVVLCRSPSPVAA